MEERYKKRTIERAVKRFGMKVGNGGVICLIQEIFPIDKENYLIPIEKI